MRIVLAGAAALALASTGAIAEPGKGKGNEKGLAKPAAAHQGGKGADRGKPKAAKDWNAKADHAGGAMSKAHNEVRKDFRKAEKSAERLAQPGNRNFKADTRRGNGDLRLPAGQSSSFSQSYGLIEGCPPGLARKNNGCLPPGQAKKQYAVRDSWQGYTFRPSLFGLGNYGDGRYLYSDGYLMRANSGGGILGYIPLLGGALSTGNIWPTAYQNNPLPDYYVDYYDLGGRDSYRYADNVIYRVDPRDSAIASVAALLTGDEFAIGQPMPRGYDVYNVPYSYRDLYYDTPEAKYRYADGYVYRIDPKTQLVAAAIDLLI